MGPVRERIYLDPWSLVGAAIVSQPNRFYGNDVWTHASHCHPPLTLHPPNKTYPRLPRSFLTLAGGLPTLSSPTTPGARLTLSSPTHPPTQKHTTPPFSPRQVDSHTFITDYSSRQPLAMRPDLGEGGNLRPVVDLLVEQIE